jgi:hypothetical protein
MLLSKLFKFPWSRRNRSKATVMRTVFMTTKPMIHFRRIAERVALPAAVSSRLSSFRRILKYLRPVAAAAAMSPSESSKSVQP